MNIKILIQGIIITITIILLILGGLAITSSGNTDDAELDTSISPLTTSQINSRNAQRKDVLIDLDVVIANYYAGGAKYPELISFREGEFNIENSRKVAVSSQFLEPGTKTTSTSTEYCYESFRDGYILSVQLEDSGKEESEFVLSSNASNLTCEQYI